MTLTISDAPATPLVTAGDAQVTVQWSDPANTGNSAIIGYILTPYIGTHAQPALSYPTDGTGFNKVVVATDGLGNDLLNGTAYTFRVAVLTAVGLGLQSPFSVAVTPTPIAQAAITADPWDYNTTRLQFSMTDAMRKTLDKDISGIFVPRVAITRSGSGFPTTPLDGVKLIDMTYDVALGLPYYTHINLTPPVIDQWVRAPGPETSVYDHNLQPGHWYYYTIFLYQKDFYGNNQWKAYASAKALVPVDYKHRDRLWMLIPEYYRIKDVESLLPPNDTGDLKNFLSIIGFELDYTRTLAEGVQDVYQADRANDTLIQLLGESNLGTIREQGLGDIRYRALISVLSRLYSERGTSRGIKNLTETTSKYRTTVKPGINLMREADDSEFSAGYAEADIGIERPTTALGNLWQPLGTGSWSPPYLTLLASLAPRDGFENITDDPFIGGMSYKQITAKMTHNEFPVSAWPQPAHWTNAPSDKKRGGLINVGKRAYPTLDPTDTPVDWGVILTCGAGIARTGNRVHDVVPRLTYPSTHGLRCQPGTVYTWSLYSENAYNVNLPDFTSTSGDQSVIRHGNVAVGVMWFGPPVGVDPVTLPQYDSTDGRNRHLVLPGFKPTSANVIIPPFESLNYLGRNERVWTRNPSDPLLAPDAYPYTVTYDAETDNRGLLPDETTNQFNPKRYAVQAKAPWPNGPDQFVYAVPYVAFTKSNAARYIGCAMFTQQINPRNNFVVNRLVDPAWSPTDEMLHP